MGSGFRHPTAIVETGSIGEETRIWAFTHIQEGAVLGARCNVSDYCYIEGRVRIGDDVTIKTHVAIPDGVTIENEAFIGPHVTFTNDLRPRSGAETWQFRETRVGRGATIGANVAVMCGLTLGPYAFVGAGSVVTRDVPAHALVKGIPAKPRGFVCRCRQAIDAESDEMVCAACGFRYRRDGQGLALRPE